MSTSISDRLTHLGDELQRGAEADLAATRPRRLPRRMALAIAATAVLVPGVAIAASQLIGSGEVARSLPAGTLSLAGTQPSCTVVHENVEFHCTLERAPAPEVSDWNGTVEPTVDATKHVNGGCRSLASDGRTWQCYVGQAAVAQQIVGPELLGQYSPSPGVG